MFVEIYQAIKDFWDDDDALVAVANSLHTGRVPEADSAGVRTARPYVSIRQIPGGQTLKTTGGPYAEVIQFQFEGVADSLSASDQICKAIVDRFDRADLYVAGEPVIAFDRTTPPFIDEDDLDIWVFSIDYELGLTKSHNRKH